MRAAEALDVLDDDAAARRQPPETFRLSSDVRWRMLHGEGLVLCQRAAEVLGVNAVGARILALLADRPTTAALVAALGREYDAPIAVLEADVERFLETLVAAGVVIVEPGEERA